MLDDWSPRSLAISSGGSYRMRLVPSQAEQTQRGWRPEANLGAAPALSVGLSRIDDPQKAIECATLV